MSRYCLISTLITVHWLSAARMRLHINQSGFSGVHFKVIWFERKIVHVIKMDWGKNVWTAAAIKEMMHIICYHVQ